METRFWSNKHFVENWLNNLDEFNYRFSIKTIGAGHRGIELFVFDIDDIEEFMSKYKSGESKYAKFYLTQN